MYMFAIAITIGSFTGFNANLAYSSESHQPSVVLVQGGSGAGSGSQGLGTGKSGTGKETDAGRGTMGKKSPFGGDQPTSGDFSPNPSDATRSGSNPEDVDKTITGSEQPSGIGEKGSGQTRSTQERSGGQQPSASESMSKTAENMEKEKPKRQ